MKVLGIETSCDETAVAVVEIAEKNLNNGGEQPVLNLTERSQTTSNIKVLSNVISSQAELHAKYGGVVPNLAAREHVKNIQHVFKLAMEQSGTPVRHSVSNIDLIAVTRGPGLGPALLVGISFARALAWKYNKPLIGVNHLEGHIYSNWLPPSTITNPKSKTLNSKQTQNSKLKTQNKEILPILNLVVSGGHTELVLMKDYGKYELIGETLDDAVGEAFDKVARLLDLGYPGGPIVAKRATKLKMKNEKLKIEFPRPMEKSKDYNFSYSGLKTSVLYKVRDLKSAGIKITDEIKNEICYEFQKAATDVLISKTIRAAKEYKVRSVFLSGGVSANSQLRLSLNKAVKELGINYSQPELEYTGDNAAMIALAGYINKFKIKNDPFDKIQDHLEQSRTDEKLKIKTDWRSVEMDANLGF